MAHIDLVNFTRHQNITEAMLASMTETITIQQALINISPYDGKNQTLKNFLQDVENGLALVPEALRQSFFNAVVARLKDAARDAVTGVTIESLDNLRDVLKEYFAPRKSYAHYFAEIQAIRMRKDENTMEYYMRLNKLRQYAIAELKETYNNDQVDVMTTMLDGIALESFKRGLTDELLYAISLRSPATLSDALKITKQLERDMNLSNRTSSLVSCINYERENTRSTRMNWLKFRSRNENHHHHTDDYAESDREDYNRLSFERYDTQSYCSTPPAFEAYPYYPYPPQYPSDLIPYPQQYYPISPIPPQEINNNLNSQLVHFKEGEANDTQT